MEGGQYCICICQANRVNYWNMELVNQTCSLGHTNSKQNKMEDITCQFCQQFFDEPVLLDCKHPICSRCVQTQLSYELLQNPSENFPLLTRLKQEEETETEKTVPVCCPVCNENTSISVVQGLSHLTRDTELAEKAKEARLLKFGDPATKERVEKLETVFNFSDFGDSQQRQSLSCV